MQPSAEDRERYRHPPKLRPVMYQTWEELLFLHWPVPAEQIARTLPEGLHVDTFEDQAYLGVVPFYMKNIRPRGLPAVGPISNFLELNVRTYVHDGNGRPGVWFYSLDADQSIAVWTARRFFHLPYQHARMQAQTDEAGATVYSCQRKDQAHVAEYAYAPAGLVQHPGPQTLEYFLLERYLLFSQRKNRLFWGQVHHSPYPAQEVTLDRWDAQPIAWNGFALPSGPPAHALMSRGVTVDVFPIMPL